jgi:hypothetical protein
VEKWKTTVGIRHRLRPVWLTAVLVVGSLAVANLAASPASAATGAAHRGTVAASGRGVTAVTRGVAPPAGTANSTKLLVSATRKATAKTPSGQAVPAAPPPVINCWLNYTNPYVIGLGGPFPTAMIAQTALLYCSFPVDQLNLDSTIYWFDVNQVAFDGQSKVLTSAVTAAPLDQCVSGTYKAVMDVRIVFPPGYEPNPQGGTVTTANTWYDC